MDIRAHYGATSVSNWNDIRASVSSIADMVDFTTGSGSGISLTSRVGSFSQITIGAGGSPGSGDASWVNSGLVTANAGTITSSYTEDVFTGFAANQQLVVQWYGINSSGTNEVAVTVNGATQNLATAGNLTNCLTFNTTATASGEVTVRWAQYISQAYAGALRITEAATTLTCDSITGGTIRAGDTVTIQLSNATNASGKTLSIPQGAITPSAQDINSISFIAPDLKTFGDKTGDYSTNITITVTDDLESDTIDFQIAPDAGDEVGAITALEGIYAEAAFSGVAVTDLYYTATISGADFTVGAVPVLSTEQTFNLWIQDQTDGVWGDPFVVTIPGSATASSAIILRPVLRDVLRPVLRDIFNEG